MYVCMHSYVCLQRFNNTDVYLTFVFASVYVHVRAHTRTIVLKNINSIAYARTAKKVKCGRSWHFKAIDSQNGMFFFIQLDFDLKNIMTKLDKLRCGSAVCLVV